MSPSETSILDGFCKSGGVKARLCYAKNRKLLMVLSIVVRLKWMIGFIRKTIKAVLCLTFVGQVSISFSLEPLPSEQNAQYNNDASLSSVLPFDPAKGPRFGNVMSARSIADTTEVIDQIWQKKNGGSILPKTSSPFLERPLPLASSIMLAAPVPPSADIVLGQPDMYGYTSNNILGDRGMKSPYGLVIGGGRLYVSDSKNNRILWWNTESPSTYQQADGVIGQPDFISSGNGLSDNRLSQPYDIAVDSAENVWVADFFNCRVLKFAKPTSNGQSASLVLGQTNFISNLNPYVPTAYSLGNPSDVAIDSAGNVWVTDYINNRVLKYTTPNANGQSASLVLGQTNFTSYNHNTTTNTLSGPLGIALDSANNVWVVDYGNNRILKYTSPSSNGQNAGLVLGQINFTSATSGLSAGSLAAPHGIAVDGGDNVWVADTLNSRVLKFASPSSNGQSASLVLGQVDFTGFQNPYTPTAYSLGFPYDVAVDSVGNVWVADSGKNRVLKYTTPNSNGQSASLVLGQPDMSSDAPNDQVGESGLRWPRDVVIGGGRVYISDTGNNRILWWNSSFPSIYQQADGVIGQPDFISSSSGTTAGKFNRPKGIALDSANNVWVADFQNNRALKFTTPNSNGQSASLVLGQANFTSRGTAYDSLSSPSGLALDNADNVWVADYGHDRVLKYTSPSSNGQSASLVLGQLNFTSFGNGVGPDSLYGPEDVAVDDAGSVWVADYFNNRVLKYTSPSSNGQSASLVLGQSIFTSSASGCTANSLRSPIGVAVDGAGNVWVAEAFNSRILKYTSPNSTGQSASFVLGQPDFTICGAATGPNKLWMPQGVSIDYAGNVWVVDTAANRVLGFIGLGFWGTPLNPSVSLGVSSLTFTWGSVPGAQYIAVLSSSSDYSNIISSGAETVNSKVFSDLASGTTYWFEVRLSTETDAAYNGNRIPAQTTPPPLAVALDSLAFDWISGGNAEWIGESAVYLFGGYAAQSGHITHSQSSYLQTTIAGPGELDFFWKVSSEANYDYLKFYIDNVLKANISGSRDWEQVLSSGIPAGQHTIKWEYIKDGNTSTGYDAGWLDKVGWHPTTPLSPATTQLSSFSFTAAWAPASSADYTAVLATDPDYSVIIASFTLAANTTIFTALSAETTYYFEVKITSEINSAFLVNRFSVRTSPPPPPGSPEYFFGEPVGPGLLKWQWPDVSSETGYKVLSSTEGMLSGNLVAGTTFWIEMGLHPNTAYSRKVLAYNTGGESTLISASTFTLAATPATVSAVTINRTGIRASWNASGNPAQTIYNLKYSSAPASYWQVVSTNSATFDLTDLLSGTTYQIKVCAINGAGILTPYIDGNIAVTLSNPAISSLYGITSGTKMYLTIKGRNFYSGDQVRIEKSAQVPVDAAGTPAIKQDHSEIYPIIDLASLMSGMWNVVVYNADTSDSGASGSNLLFISTVSLGGGLTQSLVDSSITSTITIPGSIEQIIVPPGVIPAGYVLVSTNPDINPIIVSAGTILAATQALPHGYFALNIREYAAYSNNAVLNSFLEPVTFSINYQDTSPDDGIIDGKGIQERDLKLVTLDEAGPRWVEVPVGEYLVNTTNNTVTARRNHFSVYALLGVSMAENLSQSKIYPIPWQPNSAGKFGSANVAGCGAGLIFDNLTSEGKIRIYTITGDLVREISFTSTDNGCKSWDGKNSAVRNVASGLYIAVIKNTGAGGGSSSKKLAIER